MSCTSLLSMTTHTDLAAITGELGTVTVRSPIPHEGDEDGATISYENLSLDRIPTLDPANTSYDNLTLVTDGHVIGFDYNDGDALSSTELTIEMPPVQTTGEYLAAVVADEDFVALDGRPQARSLDKIPYSGIAHTVENPNGLTADRADGLLEWILPPTNDELPDLGPLQLRARDMTATPILVEAEEDQPTAIEIARIETLATLAYENLESISKGTVIVGPHHNKRTGPVWARREPSRYTPSTEKGNSRRKAFVDNCLHTLSLYRELGQALQKADPSGAKYNVFLREDNVPHGNEYFGTSCMPTHLMAQFIVGATVAQAMYDVAVQAYENGCSIEGLMPRTLEPMEIERGVRNTYAEFAGSARNMLMIKNNGIIARNALVDALGKNRYETQRERDSPEVGDTLTFQDGNVTIHRQ